MPVGGEAPLFEDVLGVRVDVSSYADAATRISRWIEDEESRYVCACNVHMLMEAHDDSRFREVVNAADLVVPDGMPVVWMLRLLGVRGASRVYGPDLMLELCRMAEAAGTGIGLYGSTNEVMSRLTDRLRERYPRLSVRYAHSPPTDELTNASGDLARMSAAGTRLLFVALGCPKQERWMHRYRGTFPLCMIGVGAAFDFIAGTKRQAPSVLRQAGLEWAFRLATEPSRLWRRYALHNPRFVVLAARQVLGSRLRLPRSDGPRQRGRSP